MQAFIVNAPKQSSVSEVSDPTASDGQVVVKISRAGVCGTDYEFFDGSMSYLHSGEAKYPIRLGHEWCGEVISVADSSLNHWLGKRVIGDTMLGCQKCYRCLSGRQHLCETRFEIGIRNGWEGALAEQLLVPAFALHELPDSIDDEIGALVEPAGNAFRAALAAGAQAGKEILIFGTGTIGLLTAQFAMAQGASVHMVGTSESTISLARQLGVTNASTEVPDIANGFDAVIDATDHEVIPAKALDVVEYGGRVVYIGLSRTASLIDSRKLALKDVTAVGILSASPGLKGAIEALATGSVNPRPLIGAVVGLHELDSVLSGVRPANATSGPKIQVDPRIKGRL